MLYLLGINHRVQWDKNIKTTKEFESYLKEEISKNKVTFIGEEFNEETLKENLGATSTTVKVIADELGITHKYCDPDKAERDELKIKTNKEIEKEIKQQLGYKLYIPRKDINKFEDLYKTEKAKHSDAREDYWLKQILPHKQDEIIFICGMDHLNSFKILLENNKISVTVLDKSFDKID